MTYIPKYPTRLVKRQPEHRCDGCGRLIQLRFTVMVQGIRHQNDGTIYIGAVRVCRMCASEAVLIPVPRKRMSNPLPEEEPKPYEPIWINPIFRV